MAEVPLHEALEESALSASQLACNRRWSNVLLKKTVGIINSCRRDAQEERTGRRDGTRSTPVTRDPPAGASADTPAGTGTRVTGQAERRRADRDNPTRTGFPASRRAEPESGPTGPATRCGEQPQRDGRGSQRPSVAHQRAGTTTKTSGWPSRREGRRHHTTRVHLGPRGALNGQTGVWTDSRSPTSGRTRQEESASDSWPYRASEPPPAPARGYRRAVRDRSTGGHQAPSPPCGSQRGSASRSG